MTAVATSLLRPRAHERIGWVCLVVLAAVVIGVAASTAPALAFGAIGGVAFLVITSREVASGVALFTVLMFFDRTTALQSGGVTPVKAAGAILTLLWLVVVIDRRRRAPLLTAERPLVAAAAAALVAWALLSSLWAQDAAHAISTAFRLAQGVVLLFVVYTFVTRRSHVRAIVLAFIGGALFAAFVGILGKYSANAGVNDGRLSGGFDDPNELAAVLLPAIVFAVAWAAGTRRRVARVFLAASVPIMGISFLRTDSQAGLVALGVVLVLGVAFSGGARRHVTVGVAFFLLAATFYYTFVTQPVALQTITSDDNTSNRKTLWSVAGQMVEDHPVAGVGAGNFVVLESSYALEDMNLKRADLVVEGEIVHNTYLEVFAELGAAGLALFLGLIAVSLRGSFRSARAFARTGDRELEMLSRGVFIGTVGMLVAYVFATNIYEKQLWLLIALGVALPSVARLTSAAPAPPPTGGTRGGSAGGGSP